MAEDDRFVGRHIILVIIQSDTGNRRFGIEFKNFSSEPFSVSVVGHQIKDQGSESDSEGRHSLKLVLILFEKTV